MRLTKSHKIDNTTTLFIKLNRVESEGYSIPERTIMYVFSWGIEMHYFALIYQIITVISIVL